MCNPEVQLTSSDTMLSETLTRLAEEFEFKLSFPVSLDRPVRVKKSMKLNRLIKTLTADLNTVFKHKQVTGCATPILTQLIILPVGTEASIANFEQPVSNPDVEYLVIDNMEQYVTSVMNGKQNAELERMTPEQQAEYHYVLETLQAQQGQN